MRQMLSQGTIAQNVQALHAQLQRYLAVEGDNGAIVVNNADWLAELKYIDFYAILAGILASIVC